MNYRFFITGAIMVAVLMGQGCLGGSSSQTSGADGGVYKTTDRGETWVQKRVLLKGPKAVSLGNDIITDIQIDPQDPLAIYAGTSERGIIYSLDGGDSWEEVTKGPKGNILSIAIDPKDKCTVFATMRNKIYKTENCHRDWEEMFFDPKTTLSFTSIAIDWFNPLNIYAGTSEGDIFKSTDGGLSWLVAYRMESAVTDILVDNKDSRTVYVATNGDGIGKTLDGGENWLKIRNQLKEFSSSGRRMIRLIQDTAETSRLYAVSKYGLLISDDGGEMWSALALTNEAKAVEILDVSVNPRDENEIQYITANAILMSSDRGETWASKQMPAKRPATVLRSDIEKGDTIYLGFGQVKK